MLLLDTSQHPVKERAEIVRGMLGELAGSTIELPEADASMPVRLRAWEMGDGCSLFHTQGSGLCVRRLSPHLDSSETRNVSFSIQRSGSARFSQNGRDEVVPSGGMFLAEMTEVYTWQSAGSGENATFQIPIEVLDLPLRDVRNAAQWLALSPVYGLACQHLLTLSRYTEAFDAPQPSAQQAAIHVLRALVRSFGTD